MTALRTFVKSYLGGTPIEFKSPFSLEDCVTRLRNMAERKWLLSSTYHEVAVKLMALGEESYSFRLTKSGRKGTIELMGTLQRIDTNSTLIVGTSQIANSTYAVLVIIFMIAGIVLLPSSNFLIFSFVALYIGIDYLIVIVERDNFARLLQQTLEVPVIAYAPT